MRVVLILLSVVLIAKESNAWVIDVAPRIKAFAGKAMCTGIAISICLSPVHATAAEFAGSYSDPFHPSCSREIQVNGNTAVLLGEDGNPECGRGATIKSWKLLGKVDGDSIFVDFSPKGGPANLLGKWENTSPPGIRWPDSYKWTKK